MKKTLALLLACLMVVSCFALTACGRGKKREGEGEYTYRMGPSDLPTAWNPHTYESNSSTYVLDYTGDALYTFDYKDVDNPSLGFEIVPSMAADVPEDVTADYAGQFGIPAAEEGEEAPTGYAYRIPIKDGLKYDNGDDLTAEDFVESVKLLLNPKAANHRADHMYAGTLKIVNAENYFKQGSTVDEPITKAYPAWASQADVWNTVIAEMGDEAIFDIAHSYVGAWLDATYGTQTVERNGGYNGTYSKLSGVPVEALNSITGKTINEILADATMKEAWLAALGSWQTDPGEELHFWSYKFVYPEMDFSEVGFFADGDAIVIVLIDAVEAGWDLNYNLCTDFFLVHPETYKACEEIDADGVYTNSYGTSVDTFVGFGPYKLTEYVADSRILLEKNELWHNHSEGTYQTTRVLYQKVDNDATRREMFEKGELDSYGLLAKDMADYISSPYLYYTDSESTWYLAMNPDMDVLTEMQEATKPKNEGYEVNKTVLTIQEFRQALSYSLDREAFNLQLSPTSGIAKALLSEMIVADPLSGTSYRATEEAKDAILEFWGLDDQVGEGKRFATKEDAIASITGYDPEGAKELFKEAYNKAVEQELISAEALASGKWEVQICIGIPSDVDYYNDGAAFFETCWTEAVKGTPFEGHLTFIKSQELGSTSFGQFLREGQVDLLFGVGYGGSMFDPFSTMLYMVVQSPYDALTDKSEIPVEVELDGVTYRSSLENWVVCMNGYEIPAAVIGENGEATGEVVNLKYGAGSEQSLRVKILAACEKAYMGISNIFPLQTDTSASLRGMRIVYKTEEYILGLGRGGIKYYTYTMDDADWKDYVAEQGGVVNYK